MAEVELPIRAHGFPDTQDHASEEESTADIASEAEDEVSDADSAVDDILDDEAMVCLQVHFETSLCPMLLVVVSW